MFDFVGVCSYNNHMDNLQAVKKLIAQLKRIDGRTSPWAADYTFNVDVHETVLDHDEFLDAINSFPCLMVTATESTVTHIGGGQRYAVVRFRIRAVTWDETVEDAGELVADDVEHVIAHMRSEYPEFDEVRLDTIQTDEGLNAPMGAAVLQGTLVYRND